MGQGVLLRGFALIGFPREEERQDGTANAGAWYSQGCAGSQASERLVLR